MTMQKNILTTLLLLLFAGVGMAQNLIVNPSFEAETTANWSGSESPTIDNWTLTFTTTGSTGEEGVAHFGKVSSRAHSGSIYVNGGSNWGNKTKAWECTLVQTGIVVSTGDFYELSFYSAKKGCSEFKAELINSSEVSVITVNSNGPDGYYRKASGRVRLAAGTYTIKFTMNRTEDGQKEDYFWIDDVSLTAVTPIQFSDGSTDHWYYINFAEYGIIVAGQGTISDDQQQLITAYPTGNNDHHLWKFEGTYDSFKMKNKGNNHYARINNNKFQTIKNDKSANDFAFKAGTSSRGGWVITQSGEGNVTGMNASGGNFGGHELALWQNGSEGLATTNNALTIIPADGFESLNNGTDIANGERKDVSVTRTFAEGWGTLCLPFDVQIGQLKANFGDDVELYSYTGEEGGTITFTRANLSDRDDYKCMDAGKPYLIKASASVTDPVFAQRVLSTTVNNVTPDGASVAFKGNYASSLSSAGLYGVTADGYIMRGIADVNFGPWMAYFETSGGSVKLNLMIDGETTAIGELKSDGSFIEKGSNTMFDLSGRRVAKPHRGLYIVNGKKVIVK